MPPYRSGVAKQTVPQPRTQKPVDPTTGLMTTEWQTFLDWVVESSLLARELEVILLAEAGEAPAQTQQYLTEEGLTMPATLIKAVPGTLLTAALVALYTVPANAKLKITLATVTNQNSGTPRTVTVHLVPSGGTPSDANKIIQEQPITFGSPVALNMNHILNTGDSIQALADAPGEVMIQISGALL